MSTAPTDTRSPLFTDLYQLTMLQAYFREGMSEPAVFDLFVRRLRHRNYLLACGLDTALDFLETLHFTTDELDYLAEQDAFGDDFLDYLADFRFTGDVYAVPEGTPIFADEPLLEVVAPIGEAQLVETYLLNQITFQTGLASKAARVVHAARRDGTDRTVADFGMRRMHGTDAALKAARAYHIAGVNSTSNVLAGQTYGLPITGTMAHSYIEAHDSEMDAFEAFARLYPETTLLVDTYDTLDGVRKVVALAETWGDGFRVQAIRLDSGELAALAHRSRQLLDDAGLEHIKIFASSSLDEYTITDLLDRGAPIDGFGVGTRMGTMADQPYLDSAYKLANYAGKPRMKLSTEKSNLPGRKQVVRQFENGVADCDIITTHDETIDGEPLLQCVMKDGARTDAGQPRALDDLRAHAAEQQARLPSRLRALSDARPAYSVTLSDRLAANLEATRERLESEMEA
jgi:nicotinate phosphoribosyltransferase